MRTNVVPALDETTKQGIIRFAEGGWLAVRNRGWGIFEITDASADMQRYVGWRYYLNTPDRIEPARWPHILLLGARRVGELAKFWYITREVTSIESVDASWR